MKKNGTIRFRKVSQPHISAEQWTRESSYGRKCLYYWFRHSSMYATAMLIYSEIPCLCGYILFKNGNAHFCTKSEALFLKNGCIHKICQYLSTGYFSWELYVRRQLWTDMAELLFDTHRRVWCCYAIMGRHSSSHVSIVCYEVERKCFEEMEPCEFGSWWYSFIYSKPDSETIFI